MVEIEHALQEAGVEVYNIDGTEFQIAERIRLHLMDSGVRVRVDDGLCVRFTARAQQSDAPQYWSRCIVVFGSRLDRPRRRRQGLC